eukprot:9477953-Pyramimonas_sp.AAC.1
MKRQPLPARSFFLICAQCECAWSRCPGDFQRVCRSGQRAEHAVTRRRQQLPRLRDRGHRPPKD